MLDLNDLYYFSEIVAHGGYSSAARVLGQPKSKLSRRIVQLEERLGLRLIDRSTRKFSVTEAGRAVLEQARPMITAARDISTLAQDSLGEPRGVVRLACSRALAALVRCRVRTLLADCPEVRIEMTVLDLPESPLDDSRDVVLRLGDGVSVPGWSVRPMTVGQNRLVSTSAYLAALTAEQRTDLTRPRPPDEAHREGWVWTLYGPGSGRDRRGASARLTTSDPDLVVTAACDGLGIALLPDFLCGPALWEGRLTEVPTNWTTPAPGVELAMPTSRLLLPAARALADSLAAAFAGEASPAFVAREPLRRSA